MTTTWQPTASWENLKTRSKIMQQIRNFFAARGVLEVDTPLLSHGTVTDLHLHSMQTEFNLPGGESEVLYLQTSPEFGMKRLLAAGSGPIYQICKAFRNEEMGRQHNPEFTMLEWYRPGFDHHQLMDEMDELLQTVLKTNPAERCSYRDIFLRHLDIDPLTASASQLQQRAKQHGLNLPEGIAKDSCDNWLHLLMSHLIEPQLGREKPLFLYNFPASQAALARISSDTPPVALRFEVYIQGVELANGYYELADANEQQRRFENDLLERQRLGLPLVQIDKNLVAALTTGFPDCAGVALGIDRLIMLALATTHIKDVISFPVDRA